MKIKKAKHNILNFQHSSPESLQPLAQHLILNLPHPYFNFQVSLIDLSQPDIQILYGPQIDDGIQ